MDDKVKSLLELIDPFAEECKRVKCNCLKCNDNIRNKCMKVAKYSCITPKEMKKFLSNIDNLENILTK